MRFLSKSVLAKNAGWMFLGQGLGYGLRMAYFIVIARLLGVLQYGIVVGAFALVNLVAEYGRLGSGTVLLRYVSPDHSRFALYWGNILAITSVMSGLLIVTLHLIAPHIVSPATAAIVFITAIGTCFFEQITVSATQAFQAFQDMRTAALFNQMTSMFRTVVAVGMLVTLHHASAWQWAIASAIASAIAMVAALIVVTRRLGWPEFSPHLAWRHGKEGVEYAFASSTTSAYNDLDKTMLSHYGMSAANGIYGMAYRIIEMGTAPLTSIQLASQPRLFQLAESGADQPIRLGRRLMKHSLLVSAATALGMYVLAPLIPLMAGRGFSEGTSALRWLCFIPIFRSVHATSGSVLTAIGRQRYRTITQIIVVALNFGLNVWLIPTHGWHGAAWASLATDGTLALLNWSLLEREGRKFGKEAAQVVAARGSLIMSTADILKPLVSVIIPFYNQPKFVPEAVLSAKNQDYPSVEIIVVDDGSTVPADSLIKRAPGVTILRTENRGVSAARNLGFSKSSGEFLIFLDADDRLMPGAIEAHLRALENHPEAGLSFGPTKIIDHDGVEVRPAHICRPRKEYFLPLLESNLIGSPGAVMMRRESFVAAGMFNESFSMGEDYDLYLRIARQKPLVRHTFCTLEYREHGSNTSQAQEKMLRGTMLVLDHLEPALTDSERRKLIHARRRWEHEFRPNSSFKYRLWNLYYSFRTMWNVPIRSYFGNKH
jgi:O-antigen/teichoic acid export membrane protein/glycosyltransferase involved in cell wall biosynthesis